MQLRKSEMASKAITSLGSESTETKGSVWDIAIDGIATRRRQTVVFVTTSTASTESTNLEAVELSPTLFIQHQRPHQHLGLARLHHRNHLLIRL